jgi:DNA-binding response OmpR family regulator
MIAVHLGHGVTRATCGKGWLSIDLDNVTVLYVDDDATLLEIVEGLLARYGTRVCKAASAKEAWEQLERDTPDVILCDVLMPDQDGHAFHLALRAHSKWRGVPFIYLTALGDYPAYRRGMDLGADGFLSKPFTRAKLVQELKHVLERYHAVRAEQPVRVTLLGAQHVQRGGELYKAPDRGAEQLVFYLLVNASAGERVSRDQLVRDVWGELTPSGFRSVLSRARRWCSGWADLHAVGVQLGLTLRPEVQCDLHQLKAALARDEPGAVLERLYPGELLPAYDEPWVLERREALMQRLKSAFAREAAALPSGRERAQGWRRVVNLDPFDEAAWAGYLRELELGGMLLEHAQALKERERHLA